MSKKELGAKGIVMPGAVFVIGTYDENGAADAMNAAWCGQCGPKHVALNLSKHKTTDNLEKTGAFTVAFADKNHIVQSDYVGLVSANKEPEKLKKAGLTTTKSEYVNAPVINEYPVTLECKVVSMAPDESTGETRIVGEIVNVLADEEVLTEGRIDWKKVCPIVFDSVNAGYLLVSDRVGNAFKDGSKLM